jgi:alginate O-acetyltransferase complex protein AlgI
VMPFNSLNYLLFLPVVYLVIYCVGERARWCVLLSASLLFYSTLNVPYLLGVLLLIAVSTYGFGIRLDQSQSAKIKKRLLWSGIATNVLILVLMKYLPFLSENLNSLLSLLSSGAHILPAKAFVAIGVSFYVFQAISYLIDIYLGIEKPERHFGYFALYLAFFPKLLQGPIERASNLIPQLKARYEFNYDNMRFGMLLFAWGLFKKVVIADRLGLYVDAVYNDVHAFSGLPLLLATYAYAFQIFMDFSGYTDMALGSARLFNINLTQNFNSPYLSTSISDFWRRWHISLSAWFRDYVYIPLGGNRVGSVRRSFNLMIVFLLCGIWHGAGWGFIIWGLLHGLYITCSAFYKPYQKKMHTAMGIEKTRLLKVWQIFITFNLVSFAWVFFRASNLSDSVYIINNLFSGIGSIHNLVSLKATLQPFFMKYGKGDFIIVIGASLFLIIVNGYFCKVGQDSSILRVMPGCKRWCMYYLIAVGIIFFGLYNTPTNFIYLQF